MPSSEHIKFNINEKVRVKLNDRGRAHLKKQWHDLVGNAYPWHPPTEDADGWSEWQLWVLMHDLGPDLVMGFNPPFETTIEIIVEKK